MPNNECIFSSNQHLCKLNHLCFHIDKLNPSHINRKMTKKWRLFDNFTTTHHIRFRLELSDYLKRIVKMGLFYKVKY